MDKSQKNELDEQLKQLALTAQQHPKLSQQRQLALTRLINKVMQSRRISRPYKGQFLGIYEEIYDDAVQELLLYICENIEKYDPQRGSVITWINVLLERRFFKEAIPRYLDKPGIQKVTLSELDDIAQPKDDKTITEILKECIELDPENLFKQEHLKDEPKVNFQVLCKRRISGSSWEEIADEFNVKIKTVSSFYYRCLNKFSAKLKEYCILI